MEDTKPDSDDVVRSVIAFAGRRIDGEDAGQLRFPFENVPFVREAIAALFARERPVAIVASGACGGDLTALEVAETLGIKIRIVLPYAPERFRETSVVDRPRPEYWGTLFDRLVSAAQSRGDLVVLAIPEDDPTAYSKANQAIVDEATVLADARNLKRRLAVIAWDGAPRGATDATKEFADIAVHADFRLEAIPTLVPHNRQQTR